jgi:Flp pilus assembly protein TadG
MVCPGEYLMMKLRGFYFRNVIEFGRLYKQEKGSVLILTVLFLPVIFAFAAFAVDGGLLYLAKNQLQAAADASALAGGSALVVSNDENEANNLAVQYAHLNKCLNQPVTQITVTVNYPRVTVDASCTVNMFFARLLGINTATLNAHSISEVGESNGIRGMEPFVIPNLPYTFGQRVVLKPGTAYNPSFYGMVKLPGGGKLDENIANPPTDYIMRDGDQLEVEKVTGNKVGLVRKGVNAIIARDPDAYWVPGNGDNQGHIADSDFPGFTSPRILKIGFTNSLATDPIIVTGTGAFFLEGSDGKNVTGNFIRITSPGEWASLSEIPGKAAPGILKVKLIQ